jgi:probable F420-dependent oxidoreductase
MRFGITFGQLHPAVFADAAVAADELGFESAWLPEHLVFPVRVEGELLPGEEHPPVPPTIPIFDAPAYLSYLAGLTSRLRLGTYVYLLGIRHPFVGARGFATLDVVSGGRAICGVGAGWLRTEWEAVGLDPATRGARLDEAIGICRRLWQEETIEHRGEHFDFEPVAFEPKPVQQPFPVHVGGESDAALRRAARLGDGWLGMVHTPGSAAARVSRLRQLAEAAGRDPVEVTVMGEARTPSDIDAFAAAGVDRLIITPWRRSREALDAMERFAADCIG